jgi:hypothetical protein
MNVEWSPENLYRFPDIPSWDCRTGVSGEKKGNFPAFFSYSKKNTSAARTSIGVKGGVYGTQFKLNTGA